MPFNPFYYCDSPLPMERIRALEYDMKNANKSIEELRADLQKLIDTLNVPEEVAKQLNKMYEDGAFDEIITTLISQTREELEEEIRDSINNYARTNTTHYHRIWRTLNDTGLWKGVNNNSTHYYNWSQGGCVYKNRYGELTYFSMFADNRSSTPMSYTNSVCARKYRPNSITPIREAYMWGGHANGATYNPDDDRIYVSPWSYYRDNAVEVVGSSRSACYKIVRFNEEDFSDVQISADFDRHSDTICYYNGKLYGVDPTLSTNSNKLRLFEYDVSDEYFSSAFTGVAPTIPSVYLNPPRDFQPADMQYFTINRDKIFIFFGGSGAPRIAVYDFNTGGEVEWEYEVPTVGDWVFNIGEVENISFCDDVLYIMSCSWLGTAGSSQYTMTQIFKTDIYHNDVSGTQYDWYARSERNIEYYVDGQVGLNPNNVNPHGGSSKPFATLQEAVAVAQTYPNNNIRFRITLNNNNTSYTQISGNANIVIDGNKKYIGGLLVNGSKVNIYDAYVGVTMPSGFTNTNTTSVDGCINAQYGTIYTSNVIIYQPSESSLYFNNLYNFTCNNGFITTSVNPGNYHLLRGGHIMGVSQWEGDRDPNEQ